MGVKPKVGSDEWLRQEHEQRVTQHTDRCVHFNGYQHGICEAGITYPKPLPCLRGRFSPTGGGELVECEKRRWTTREEAEADIAETNKAFERINTCMKAIRAKHGKARGLVDSMPCPTGCGGTLRYSIASYNGHCHGACSTEGCARWMQ